MKIKIENKIQPTKISLFNKSCWFGYLFLLFSSKMIWLVKIYDLEFRIQNFKIGCWIRWASYKIQNFWKIYVYLFIFSRSFEVLANAIGFKKSFSTSDILGIESSAQYSSNKPFFNLNRSHSEIQLSNYAPLFRLEASSRSLSTWVAVGDTSATTQLPSPQVWVWSQVNSSIG